MVTATLCACGIDTVLQPYHGACGIGTVTATLCVLVALTLCYSHTMVHVALVLLQPYHGACGIGTVTATLCACGIDTVLQPYHWCMVH